MPHPYVKITTDPVTCKLEVSAVDQHGNEAVADAFTSGLETVFEVVMQLKGDLGLPVDWIVNQC